MKHIDSVVVSFDGESKCGKTTLINNVANEAIFQAGIIPRVVNQLDRGQVPESTRESLLKMHELYYFDNIVKISAGNVFRAAALHVALLELGGHKKNSFNIEDSDDIRELLAVGGIEDILQDDPNIGRQVSIVGKMAGVQALCATIFCDEVVEAYHRDNRANLVLADARDPIGHLERNGRIGNNEGQVVPASILPFYIETSPEAAASRMKGDYNTNLALVIARRESDANRTDLPVLRPAVLLEDFDEWYSQFMNPDSPLAIAEPYLFHNGEKRQLDNVQNETCIFAAAAQNQGVNLFHTRTGLTPFSFLS